MAHEQSISHSQDFRRVVTSPESQCASAIQGQLLRLSARREVAIYLREGTLWVADFIDGQGEITNPTTWFRFNCGALSTFHARRRMVLESAVPLSSDLVKRIECLHRQATAQKDGVMAALVEAAAINGPRKRLAKILGNLFQRQPSDRVNRTRSERDGLGRQAQ